MQGVGFLIDGGLAEFVAVPERLLFRIPTEMSFRTAALTEPLAVGFHGVRRARLESGERVLVGGAGAVGLAVIQSALVAGASEIIVSDPNPARRDLAQRVGATAVIDPTRADLALMVREITRGLGVDAVFDAAGAQSFLDPAVAALRKRGRFVSLATWKKLAMLNMNALLVAEHEILFAFGYEATKEFPRVLDLMANGRLAAELLIGREIGLNEIGTYFEEMIEHPFEHSKVLINPWKTTDTLPADAIKEHE